MPAPRLSGLLAALTGLVFSFPPSLASGTPFDIEIRRILSGERLNYDVSFGFLNAGEAQLDIWHVELEDGSKAYHLELRANTGGLLGIIYPLDVLIHSVLTQDLQRSLGFYKEQNGKVTTLDFDWRQRTVTYTHEGEALEPLELPTSAVDPLSIVLAGRTLPLVEGAQVSKVFTDGKRIVEAIATVPYSVEVEVPAGEFSTLVVEPRLENIGGVFDDSDDSSMTIWLDATGSHHPVRVSSRLFLGSIVGELFEVSTLTR